MSILIVDDSQEDLFLLQLTLQDAGYEYVITADSAKKALDILEKSKSDKSYSNINLIIMDLAMAEMDGIEASRRIKNDEQLRDIPIVILTGACGVECLEAAFDAGAIEYLIKPVAKAELLVRVRSLIKLGRENMLRKFRESELKDLTEKLASENAVCQRLAFLDGLTGIANRRYFDEFLLKEWLRSIRDQTSLSLIMIDIDHFKIFNDTYGHQAGDECLKMLAMALESTLKRPADMIARYGGEEFVVVLPETEINGALAIAETMRLKAHALNIPHESSHGHGRVTISLGVASITPELNTSPSLLITVADKALYRAKNEGRNRINDAEISAGEL